MKKRIFFGVFIFLALFFISFSSAIVGVSPPEYKVTFSPNENFVFNFNFMGDESVPMRVYTEGGLAQYAELSTEKLSGSGAVNVLLKLPGSLPTPGNHVLYVGIEQLSGPGGGVGIKGGMRATINVFEPYPGKYVVLDFRAEDAKQGENASYWLKAFNYGKEKVSVSPFIEIFGSNNKSLGRYNIFNEVVEGNSAKDDSGRIDTSSLLPGMYLAKATVNYEGRTASAEDSFRIGELFVDIKNYTNTLERNSINKIIIDVESSWNDPLDNVFVEANVLDYNLVFKTPSTSLRGFQRVGLVGYLDTNGIPEEAESLKTNFTVHYGNKETSVLGELHFKKEFKISLITYIIAGLVLVILIAIVIIWILIRRGKK